jgi:ribosome recycling factor
MTRKDTIKTLSQCIGLLSIEGENTKEEVKDKLETLRTELVADEMADIEQRVQRAVDRPIEEIEKELPF